MPVILTEEHLKLPHPYLHVRRFALEPMNEIASDALHPVYNKTISELLRDCTDNLSVERVKNTTESYL